MRLVVVMLLTFVLPAAPCLAQSTDLKGVNMRALGERSTAPVKKPSGTSSTKPCPEYGAGFYRLAGSDTCVRLGGGIGTDIGTAGVRR
jgi:hypothetical protein